MQFCARPNTKILALHSCELRQKQCAWNVAYVTSPDFGHSRYRSWPKSGLALMQIPARCIWRNAHDAVQIFTVMTLSSLDSDRKFQTKKFIGIKLAINFARSFLTLFWMSKLHEWLSIIRSTYVNIQYLPVVFINYTVVQTEVQWNFKSNFWSLYINFLSVIKILKLSITNKQSLHGYNSARLVHFSTYKS